MKSKADQLQHGYHYCIVPGCKTQLSESSPAACPKHQPDVCPNCKGRGEYIHTHNEALTPSVRHKKCRTCRGTGQVKKLAPTAPTTDH